jgi:CPA2 family monovalent cation:H+ antiporter-2
LRVLNQVQELRPGLAVIVRTLDDNDLEKLLQAGATEVVPEVLEGSLMLASHTMMMMGIPLNRVLRRVREIREQRYGLLKAFFHGATDEEEHAELDKAQPRLYSATIAASSPAIGKTLAELELDSLGVRVTAVRRRNIRGVDPAPDTVLQDEDVVVLLGTPDQLSAALLKLQGE